MLSVKFVPPSEINPENCLRPSEIENALTVTEKTIKKLTREQLIEFYEKYYIPSNMVVIVNGNLENPFKILEKYPILKDVFEKIQKDKKIKLAILFGSYAKDLAKKHSDVDIFLETNNLEIKKEYSKLDSKLSIKIGKLGQDNLSKEIRKNYILIKGGEKYYEFFFE